MKTDTQQDYEQRILRVLLHIQTHLDHALDLEELADLAHFSPYHFHRVFRGMVGEPLMEHIRRLRLERAAYRLKASDQRVTQIAFDAGYEAHEAFTRAFRGMFNESPSGFRKIHSRVPAPDSPSGVHYARDGKLEGFEVFKGERSTMNIRIERVAPTRVAFIRHSGAFDEVGATWQRLMGWAGQNGLLGPSTKAIGLSHDDPEITPADKLRYDACVAAGERVEPAGEIGVQTIAGGEYAVATHRGPYQRLGDVYAALLGQWLPANSREPLQAPCFELYRNSPQQTKPEDLLTDIHVPLQVVNQASRK